jgi:regulator of protease activity HflC (stomatin/prohibitin superfamily)
MSLKSLVQRGLIQLAITGLLLVAAGWQVVEWTINRIYVPVGSSLLLQYKGPLLFGRRVEPESGQLAKRRDDGTLEIGVLMEMPGPGRHFYCPVWWDRKIVQDQVVAPGEVGIVTSKVGKDLSGSGTGQFLVEGDLGTTTQKGILRKVYGPGTYRVNPYAYEFRIIKGAEQQQVGTQTKLSGWVQIPIGSVGVVTNQTDNPLTNAKQGIQPEVLPPGLYPMNPWEQKVDVVEIGFREKSITSTVKMDGTGNPILDPAGEPELIEDNTGISFPSKDGFPIHMDFTAIWGILPEQAPKIVEFNGNIEAVENRVVVPLIESICRNSGSTLGAVELLVGGTREKFQEEVALQFGTKLKETGVALQYGLVRHIYIPQEVRVPIQMAFIADELKLTRDQEQLTAKTEALLREAEKNVELEASRIVVETEKLAAGKLAEGQKTAAETAAETLKKIAEINKQTAELDAQARVLLGKADADSQKLMEEAKSDKFRLAVEAFGDTGAFNRFTFAQGLPEDIQLQTLYAGEGTFWTDLKGFAETMLGKQEQQRKSATTPSTQNAAPATIRKPASK